jgi:capsular exopolysaccharide synthesis family protein
MDITLYLSILWRRKFVIAITVFVIVLITTVVTLKMTPTYLAKATLRVATSTEKVVDYGDYIYSSRLLNTLGKIVRTEPTIAQARKVVNTTEEFDVSVEFPSDTELLRIAVESHDPVLSANVANALADILIDESRTIRRANIVSIIEPAIPPEDPNSPNKKVNLALAMISGLIGGLGLSFLLENLDQTLYSEEQVEHITSLPILARIPLALQERQYTWLNGESPQGEAFRRLRTVLLNLEQPSQLHNIMVTSAQPQEGKSTIVANLASTLAESGNTVMIVDADLRLPTMHTIFHLPNEVGLSNLLRAEVSLQEAIQRGPSPGIYIITSGSSESSPSGLIDSTRMQTLLQHLPKYVDYVLIDTPSFLAVTDAATLVPFVDSVILVVGRAQAQADAVQAACEQLAHLKAKLMGVIINRAQQEHTIQYQHYYFHKAARRVKSR